MSLTMHHVVFDCAKPSVLAEFWAAALGYSKEDWGDEHGAMAFDSKGERTRMLFLPVPEHKVAKNRVHIDVETNDNTMEYEVKRLVDLGATAVEQKELVTAEFTAIWTVMGDPEGNEFCVSRKPETRYP